MSDVNNLYAKFVNVKDALAKTADEAVDEITYLRRQLDNATNANSVLVGRIDTLSELAGMLDHYRRPSETLQMAFERILKAYTDPRGANLPGNVQDGLRQLEEIKRILTPITRNPSDTFAEAATRVVAFYQAFHKLVADARGE